MRHVRKDELEETPVGLEEKADYENYLWRYFPAVEETEGDEENDIGNSEDTNNEDVEQ